MKTALRIIRRWYSLNGFTDQESITFAQEDLNQIVSECRARYPKLHPAALASQVLRITKQKHGV